MDLATVTAHIEDWITNFVTVPHPALGGWPPCPYARSARLKQSYQVMLGTDPFYDLQSRAGWGMLDKEVYIYVYDADRWSSEQINASVDRANQTLLVQRDMLALADHPQDPEIVNGVSMNQGTYALILVQGLTDLNAKAQLIARQGFYHGWPEDYLQKLFEHRQDPRS